MPKKEQSAGVWKPGRERQVQKAKRDVQRAEKLMASSSLTQPRRPGHLSNAEMPLVSRLAGAALRAPRPRYAMEITWSDEDNAYLVTVPDLPGCVTHGATYIDAARMGEEAIALWLEGARHWGRPIPLPGSAGER